MSITIPPKLRSPSTRKYCSGGQAFGASHCWVVSYRDVSTPPFWIRPANWKEELVKQSICQLKISWSCMQLQTRRGYTSRDWKSALYSYLLLYKSHLAFWRVSPWGSSGDVLGELSFVEFPFWLEIRDKSQSDEKRAGDVPEAWKDLQAETVCSLSGSASPAHRGIQLDTYVLSCSWYRDTVIPSSVRSSIRISCHWPVIHKICFKPHTIQDFQASNHLRIFWVSTPLWAIVGVIRATHMMISFCQG